MLVCPFLLSFPINSANVNTEFVNNLCKQNANIMQKQGTDVRKKKALKQASITVTVNKVANEQCVCVFYGQTAQTADCCHSYQIENWP